MTVSQLIERLHTCKSEAVVCLYVNEDGEKCRNIVIDESTLNFKGDAVSRVYGLDATLLVYLCD